MTRECIKISVLISSLALTTLLNGCMTAPGSRLLTHNKQVVNSGKDHCFNVACRVKVYPITPTLINQLRKPNPTPKTNKRLANELKHYQYRVGAGDVLNVTVWDHPELTIPAGPNRSTSESGNWVQEDGTIFYPYIGHVHVEGKTLPEIRGILAERLAKYIEKPQVSVNVADFRSQRAYITGEVQKPGYQAITNIPLTVLDAVNQAGGLSQNVDWRHATLTHNGQKKMISLYALMQYGDLSQNELMQQGDILHLPRDDNQKVYVMGEIGHPQLLKIDRAGMNLSEALARVGGINQTQADASGIFVIRPRHKGFSDDTGPIANIYQLNIKDASALILGTEFAIHPNDVIYVTAAPIALWNRVVQSLLPSLSAFNLLRTQTLAIVSN